MTHRLSANRRWAIAALLLFCLLSTVWLIRGEFPASKQVDIPLSLLSTLRPEPKPLVDFTLLDQIERKFSRERLLGKWSFIFFGYTSCPDVCPTTLTEMAKVAANLAQQHADTNTQFIFVTVDPERDDVDHMREYVGYFNPEFIGLTGSQAQIDGLMKQLNILAVRQASSSPEDYQIGHTSAIALIDPEARWVASFSPPHYAETIAGQFNSVQDFLSGK